MPPSRRITMESTLARTGRLMKIRASMAVLLLEGEPGARAPGEHHRSELRRDLRLGGHAIGLPVLRGRHVYLGRLHGDARPDLLQAGDNQSLAGLQAVGDLAKAVVERPEANGAGGHLVVLVHDVHDL